jgi:Zn-dependent metalloprotease
MNVTPIRISPGGFQRTLTPAALAQDPVAAAAVSTVQAFDRFLSDHDAPSAARLPDGFQVAVKASDGDAHGQAQGIVLGSKAPTFAHPSARSPEVIGHELTHSASALLGTTVYSTYETWADIVGNTFARSVGAPKTDDWNIGEGFTPKTPAHPDGVLRSLDHPAVPDATALVDYMHAHALTGIDTHLTGGPLGRAFTTFAGATSPKVAGDLFTDAFLHDLTPRSRTITPVRERADTAWFTGPAAQREAVYAPVALEDLRSSARATFDAAARTYGQASPRFAALRDAWAAVGLGDVAWRPRADEVTPG